MKYDAPSHKIYRKHNTMKHLMRRNTNRGELIFTDVIVRKLHRLLGARQTY